jgi:hypothetical protein
VPCSSPVSDESTGEPTPLRVGVTGHRDLEDAETAARAVDGVLDDLLAARGASTPIEVRSALAEGADRLVVERVLARADSRLVAVLPLDAAEYRRDFLTPTSLAAFDRLLAKAARIDVTGTVHVTDANGGGTREAAYERAGHTIVDCSDVLVALWDGGPARGRGGTAEIIGYARERGRQVVIVPVTRQQVERVEGAS